MLFLLLFGSSSEATSHKRAYFLCDYCHRCQAVTGLEWLMLLKHDSGAECSYIFRVRKANRVLRSKCQYEKMQETAYVFFWHVYWNLTEELLWWLLSATKPKSVPGVEMFSFFMQISSISSERWSLRSILSSNITNLAVKHKKTPIYICTRRVVWIIFVIYIFFILELRQKRTYFLRF